MKKTLCLLFALVWAMAAFSQTGAEIIDRMNERINSRTGDGISLIVDVKVPVLGAVVTKTAVLGEKRRLDVKMKEHNVITFSEKDTIWIYTEETNSIIISNDSVMAQAKSSNQGGMDVDMFGDLTEGYDITIKSQNLVKWELACKRKRSNKDDDAPKNITLEVRKETYEPISMSTKMMGINCTMHDFKFGISEKEVTFNEADFPGVTIVDNRQP
jgi:outer membrane lipoprotein-sorting protein